MTKKKYNRPKHQKDASFCDTSEEEYNTVKIQGKSCPHVARGIHFGRVKKSIKSSQSIITCSSCSNAENTDFEEQPEVWLCLQCGYRGCGRMSENKHGLQHFKTQHSDCHSLVLSTTSGSIWCYDCDDEINLQSSRTLKQCVEFVMKMAPNSTDKPNISNVNKFVVQHSLQNSVIKEEPVVQNSEANTLAEKIKKPVKSNKELAAKISIKGLRNLGNTCFFNAVMQNLNQTSLLYHELKNTCNPSYLWEVPELTITNSEITETENANTFKLSLLRQFSLTSSLLNFLEQMSTASNVKVDIVNPASLFGEISKKCPQFRHFQQQDSHELLRQLLDGIRQEEIKRQKKAILRQFDLENVNPEEVDDEMKKQIKAYGCYASHTIIEKIFGGLLISTVLCEECKMSSQVFEPFMDLSLPLFEEKPLRNRKMEWDGDENVQREYVLSKPKNDLGKPSKHQEKKQKQLAKKEKKRAKNTVRNKKNPLNEHCDDSTNNQLPKANDDANEEEEEEENSKELEENNVLDQNSIDNQEEEDWELTALLEPDDNSKHNPESVIQTQNSETQSHTELSDFLMKSENESKESVFQTNDCKTLNHAELNDLAFDITDGDTESPVKSDIYRTQNHIEGNGLASKSNSAVGDTESVFKTCDICITQNKIELNDLGVKNRINKVPEFTLQIQDNTQDRSESNDLVLESSNADPEPSVQMHGCNAFNHIESDDIIEKNSFTLNDSQVDINDENSFASLQTSMTEDVEYSDVQNVGENEKLTVKSDKPVDSELCSHEKNASQVDIKDDDINIQNEEIEKSADKRPNLEDSLQGLLEDFKYQLKISDSNQSNIDDRIQALSMQIKDVRIRRDSDRQENLLNSSESADDCESQKTNCTSPKSSVEDTCSIDNGDNWSHSVSEQQTKDWISKTLTTLKPRNNVSPLECSINSCLSHFTKPELLTGNNKFRCENCTELKVKKTGNKKDVVYSNASKQLLIFSPPAVLTLHLKRFQQVGMSLRKVNRFVEFPLVLDLAPFCCSACTILPHVSSVKDEILYSLYGIVEHSGRLTSGHYTAYVKANKRTINKIFECQLPLSQCDLQQLLHKFSGADKGSLPSITEQRNENCQWYYISDSHVKEVSEAHVLKCQAYLLFYERIK